MTAIAIIMRSRNEMPWVQRSLEALAAQTMQNYTLYNCDCSSNDGTEEVIARYSSHIVTIAPEDYIPGAVLNMMIRDTQEPIIVFLNADAIPYNPEWLELLIAPLLENSADITMSRQVARPDAPFIVKDDYYRAYAPQNVAKSPYFFSNVACAFRRSLWEDTHFYEEGYSEDIAWRYAQVKNNARFLYVPDSIVEHSHTYTLRQLYQRGFIEGQAETRIFHTPPSFFRMSMAFGKASIRDFFRALLSGNLVTIPYNSIYRFVREWGLYQGRRNG